MVSQHSNSRLCGWFTLVALLAVPIYLLASGNTPSPPQWYGPPVPVAGVPQQPFRLRGLILGLLGADATGRLRSLGSNLGAWRPHCICQQLSWLHVGAVLMLELCWIQVGPCWVHWSSAGTTSAHVRSKLGLGWPGLCWGCNSLSGPMLAQLRSMLGPGSPILGLCWGYVGPFGVYVGARFAHLGAMLGLRWPTGGDFGAMLFSWVHLHSKFCLKKLSPVACEATHSICACEVPGNASWGSEQGSAVPGAPPLSKAKICFSDGHFVSKALLLLGMGIAKMLAYLGLCWRYVGPFGVYVGARFAHLGAMLGLRWPTGGDFGAMLFSWVHLHSKFCLKKLSPVACEAPTPSLQRHFSEKAESCRGRAHPRWGPEGSHQWPARFQETFQARLPLAKLRFASPTAQPDLRGPLCWLQPLRRLRRSCCCYYCCCCCCCCYYYYYYHHPYTCYLDLLLTSYYLLLTTTTSATTTTYYYLPLVTTAYYYLPLTRNYYYFYFFYDTYHHHHSTTPQPQGGWEGPWPSRGGCHSPAYIAYCLNPLK